MNPLTVFLPLAPGCATAEICPTPGNRYTRLAADGTHTGECACVRPVSAVGFWGAPSGITLDAAIGATGLPGGPHT